MEPQKPRAVPAVGQQAGWESRREDYLRRLQEFCLMDDTFMSKVFEDYIPGVQLVLEIILGRSDLTVTSAHSQHTISNLQGRSVRLDVHAVDRNGVQYDIEIQRADHGAGQKRARHNSAMMDANALNTGDPVEKLPETYVIFITENDVLHLGRPIYRIERTILGPLGDESPLILFEDGAHIVYVNGAYQDESELGLLMRDFFCKDPGEMKNKVLAERVAYLKNNPEGVEHMCRLMEELRMQGQEEGREETRAENALAMLKDSLPHETIARYTGLSIEKVAELAKQQSA